MKKYVITGGPGIGKTTLLEILASRGYSVLPEMARIIIEEETLKGSDCLPWLNLKSFQEEVAERQIEAESKAKGSIVFLDRALNSNLKCNESSRTFLLVFSRRETSSVCDSFRKPPCRVIFE